MASYNIDRDFDTMRQEAIERVRSMQRRSREVMTPHNNSERGNRNSDQNKESVPINVPPVSEMQNNSTNSSNQNTNKNNQNNNHNSNQENPIANILGNLFPNTGGQTKKGPLSELLDGFNISEENALIGMLIYILAKNGADVKLLLGLGYLLL